MSLSTTFFPMEEERITKKLLSEKVFTIGQNVTLVLNGMGPCEKKRTVKERKSGVANFVMETEEGKESHLNLTAEDAVYLREESGKKMVYIFSEKQSRVMAAYRLDS